MYQAEHEMPGSPCVVQTWGQSELNSNPTFDQILNLRSTPAGRQFLVSYLTFPGPFAQLI